MLTLRASGIKCANIATASDVVLRIAEHTVHPTDAEALLVRDSDPAPGFGFYVVVGNGPHDVPNQSAAIYLPKSFDYLAAGDVVHFAPERGQFAVLYRKQARHQTFLLTERCNHYCLMCSQPPRDIDDTWIADVLMRAIPLVDPGTPDIVFTGGEPTLLGDGLFCLIRKCQEHLPNTGIHILSNGRTFADATFTEQYASISHPDLMVGIPVYSDLSQVHDYVVQADGAFDETIRGILTLKRFGQRVEIRVVIHKQTYERLPQLAQFIARNLRFVDQVALMGLEITGFTRANLDALWIDPVDYRAQLTEATEILSANRVNVSIYNHQLCVIDRAIWPYARKSISDWKNEYMPECDGCSAMSQCGGFFSSAKLRHSEHIRPIC